MSKRDKSAARQSPGLRTKPRRSAATQKFDRFFANYVSTVLLMLVAYYFLFNMSPFHERMLTADINLAFFNLPLEPLGFADSFVRIKTIFQILIGVYAVVLIPFYLKYPWLQSKARIFLRGVWKCMWRDKGFKGPTKQAALAIFLKLFFAPLMINWCLAHIAEMSQNVYNTKNFLASGEHALRAIYDNGFFMACFGLILFVDTLLFTIGYIIESPRLKNRIITVEPTFFGWLVCLACYPPFNEFTNWFFQWRSSDYPSFESDFWHIVLNSFGLLLMAVYSWASVALGFRASNLTNRGIVDTGPYRYVRHPAYFTKNLFWWIGASPLIYSHFVEQGFLEGMKSVFFTAGWTFIYVMRAITEERHLMLTDNGYREYREKVRWRFIPGVF